MKMTLPIDETATANWSVKLLFYQSIWMDGCDSFYTALKNFLKIN
jgi:hypothetical protein